MKWIKLLIIVISLWLPIHSYACWDDDWDDDSGWWIGDDEFDDWNDFGQDDDGNEFDDWNDFGQDDDDNDFDDWNGFGQDDDVIGGMLSEVEAPIPNDDDNEFDNDWWRRDYDDDTPDDNGNDDWWGDDDDDVGSWTNTDEKNNQNAPDYWKNQTWHIPAYNEYLLNWKKWENYPEHWQPQTGQNCVSVALEYIANCLDGSYPGNDYIFYRDYFESLYLQAFGRDLFQLGVDPSHLSSFYGLCGFDVESISYKDVQSCILNNTPVMGVIASGENSAHELFVIGYFADTDMYQTLNPATGTFQAFNKNDFYGNTLYKVNSFK